MEEKRLAVLIAGKRAGTVAQARGGALSYVYDAGYAGIPPLLHKWDVAVGGWVTLAEW